jgi:hypothetical protein
MSTKTTAFTPIDINGMVLVDCLEFTYVYTGPPLCAFILIDFWYL